MIIGSCGYGSTGSSVLTDLLREYDDVQVYDEFEFTLTYKVDGLEDLEYHLMKQYAKAESGDFAIKRFLEQSRCYMTPFIHKPCDGKTFYRLSKEFINSITQIEYKGVFTADLLSGHRIHDFFAFAFKKVIIPKIFEKAAGRIVYAWPCRTLHYSIEPDNFYVAAREYTNKIMQAMGADIGKPICLDQPFEGNAPENSFPFYDDPRAVVIDRDPRDLYFEYKYSKHPDDKFFPRTTVEDYVVYYKNMRMHQVDNDRVLRLNFEDFIYDYDATVLKIEKFLDLKDHVRPKTGFKPEHSINNTQQFKRYPEEKKAVEYIERELAEYLYPFDKYPEVTFTGNVFRGAERKYME